MDDSDAVRLHHMLEAALEASAFAGGETRESLEADRKLALAIIKDLEIIGEAAAKVSPATRQQHSQVPWNLIVGMRNRLIHAYFDVDYDQVWSAVTKDLPLLVSVLRDALAE